ncbi:MAG: cation-translocating P-type ATPase [Oscillospiraceae bacterium]|nr:cation-translocating P-type ATPase [Oscillospiraceae bacterium]
MKLAEYLRDDPPQNGAETVRGLTSKEAARRQSEHGKNRLAEGEPVRPFKIFLCQFKDFLTLVLLGGTAVSVLTGEYAEALTIAVIILLNGILGFLQEYRTERTLETLKKMAAPKARVWRDGALTALPSEEIVPGDILLAEAGDRVPADCLILEASGLSADESMLTGESVPAGKTAAGPDPEKGNAPGRNDMVYMGTAVSAGRGICEVTATGMDTQMGKIAGMIRDIPQEDTPLQKKLDQLGKWIALGCLVICAVVAAAGAIRGEELFSMLMTGISLAVAAVPEGLPAIVTVSLALAVRRMVKRKALIRRLAAVETLGCADVICSDKTGTLTKNRMTAVRLWLPFEEMTVDESDQPFRQGERRVDPMRSGAGKDALTVFALCCGTVETADGFSGEPTEAALSVLAAKAGLLPSRMTHLKRAGEIPFDSTRKRMSVLAEGRDGERILLTKGACDLLLNRCSTIKTADGAVPLDERMKSRIRRAADAMAAEGLQVLAAACRLQPAGEALTEQSEQGLCFCGMAGLMDPPRDGVKETVRTCRRAGIRVVMITGDHPLTAKAVAEQTGIFRKGDLVLTGAELDGMDDTALEKAVGKASVCARVTPAHKLRIVRALKKQGHITAMTGDGVNDAPAIREADIGVAMGLSGTDVTREASDLVLLDDDLSTLEAAVEEGRAIYQNIRKFIRYLLSCNIGEVLTMFLGILMGMPVVLSPIHILMVNLVTDGLPAIALGLEPAEKDVMRRPPRSAGESIFAGGLLSKILFRGCLIGLTTLFVFGHFLGTADLSTARTAAFLTLVMTQLIHVFECRSESGNPFAVPLTGSLKLIGAAAFSAAAAFLAVYWPPLSNLMETVPLTAENLLFIGLSLLAAPVLSILTSRLFTEKSNYYPKKRRKNIE